MPETRYAGDLIEHRLKYMTDFLFGLGGLGRTNLFQDRPYRFASGGAALPNGWELLFGEAISGEFSAQGTPKSRGKRKLFWKRNAEPKWNGLLRNRFRQRGWRLHR